MLARSR